MKQTGTYIAVLFSSMSVTLLVISLTKPIFAYDVIVRLNRMFNGFTDPRLFVSDVLLIAILTSFSVGIVLTIYLFVASIKNKNEKSNITDNGKPDKS